MDTLWRRSNCAKVSIQYIVSKRIPEEDFHSEALRNCAKSAIFPTVSTWQAVAGSAFVSKYHPGAVLTISIEPTYNFNDRSGMSTSTRKKAIELWKTDLPEGDLEKIAKVLFTYENEPGREYVSGSQDAIGIVFPGLNKLNYQEGAYWPTPIESITNEEHLQWLEKRLYLLTLKPRHQQMEILSNVNINEKDAKALAMAADNMWEGLKNRDSQLAGSAMTRSFEAQIKACNIQNYSIFMLENHTLFAYFEYIGNDFEADMKRMAADPMTQNGGKRLTLAKSPSDWSRANGGIICGGFPL